MDITLLLTLAGLALVDSTSYGTLVIPLVLIVVQRRVQVRPLSWYFLTVVGFYFLLGVLLTLGLDAFIDVLTDIRTSPAGTLIQLLVGGVLLLLSFRVGGKNATKRTPESLIPSSVSRGAMIGLGTTAAILEVATMVPYLSAIGLLVTSDVGTGLQISVLAGYCLVMILPAVILIAVASVLGDRLWPRLERLNAWVLKNAAESVGWLVGIAGFLIAADAASRLSQ